MADASSKHFENTPSFPWVHFAWMAKTNGFSVKPLKVQLLAGEQKATEFLQTRGVQPDLLMFASEFQPQFQLAGPGSAAWAMRGSMRELRGGPSCATVCAETPQQSGRLHCLKRIPVAQWCFLRRNDPFKLNQPKQDADFPLEVHWVSEEPFAACESSPP